MVIALWRPRAFAASAAGHEAQEEACNAMPPEQRDMLVQAGELRKKR
jgi:hypothetical protein